MAAAPRPLLQQIARFGLHAEATAIRVREVEWELLLGYLMVERLLGVAVAARERGALELSAERSAALSDRHRAAMALALSLERRLLELADAFDAEGIPMVVLKGPAIAHAFYPDPAWRSFGDLDVLVPTSRWERALATVRALGFARVTPEPRPGFDVRFGKAATHADPAGLVLDLHRTLAKPPFGLWVEPDELFERTAAFSIAGVALARLEDSTAFLHACLHAALGEHRLLMPLRDIAQIASVGDVDWDAVGALIDRWRLGAVVGYATGSLSTHLDPSLPPDVIALAHRRSDDDGRRVLEAFTTERRHRGGMSLSVVRTLPGWRSKLAYIRALALPDRAFIHAMGQSSYRDRGRHALTRLLSGHGRSRGVQP